MEDVPGTKDEGGTDGGRPDMSDDSMGDAPPGQYDDEDDDEDDGFPSGFLGRGSSGMSSALRALAGAYSSQQGKLRTLLEQLRSKDPSLQLIALQDLSELLLMATEDTLAGSFRADEYVKELVALLSDPSDDNPEMMLLACRCLANLMEALPQATANVVYGNAVPVLCSKLIEISFIDLAEQCLSVSRPLPPPLKSIY
jgi:E3 ubiquitin-protein ligase TRIP12